MRWMMVVLLAELACTDVPLARRELPGAAILFPSGTVDDERLDYEDGKVSIETRSGRVMLRWSTRDMPSPDMLERYFVTPTLEAHGASVLERGEIRVGGSRGRRWRAGAGELYIGVSMWPCGRRYFDLTATGKSNLSDVERHMRASFMCKPEPALDGQRGAIGVQIDPGPEFGTGKEIPLILASLDRETVIVGTYTPTHLPDDPGFGGYSDRIFEKMTELMGVSTPSFMATTVTRDGGAPRTVWRGIGKRKEQRVRMLATVVDCGATERYLALYLGPEAKPEAPALDVLFAARCEANPTRPPPFADVAREACARGDKRGCR